MLGKLKSKAVTRNLVPALVVAVVLRGAFLILSRGLFGGTLAACIGYGYGYGYGGTAVPTVTGVTPNTGTTAGGTSVFITGTGFCAGVTSIKFGTTPATSANLLADTLFQVVSPAHAAGTVDVTVTNPAGTSATSSADQYTFTVPTPTVYTALTPQRILDTRTNHATLGPAVSAT